MPNWEGRMPNWVRVEDRLPKDGEKVLTRNSNGLIAVYKHTGKYWCAEPGAEDNDPMVEWLEEDSMSELEQYKHKAAVWEKAYYDLEAVLVSEAMQSHSNGTLSGIVMGTMIGAFVVYLGMLLYRLVAG